MFAVFAPTVPREGCDPTKMEHALASLENGPNGLTVLLAFKVMYFKEKCRDLLRTRSFDAFVDFLP